MPLVRSTRTSAAAGALGALIPLGTACASDPGAPPASKGRLEDIPGISLTADVSPQLLHLGEVGTLRVSVRNGGPGTRTLNFTSGCQLLPYVERVSDGAVLYPDGGGWMCTGMLTSLTLAPGEEKSYSVDVRAGTPQKAIYTGAKLPVGKYRAYATLGFLPHAQAVSEAVEFEIVE